MGARGWVQAYVEKFEVSKLSSGMNRLLSMMAFAITVSGLSACISGPPQTPEQRQSNKELVESVQSALASDQTLYARHITVRADGGVVTLGGYVWTTQELAEVPDIVRSVPGVTNVVNRIEVDRGSVQDSSVTR